MVKTQAISLPPLMSNVRSWKKEGRLYGKIDASQRATNRLHRKIATTRAGLDYSISGPVTPSQTEPGCVGQPIASLRSNGG
ncbi:MAG: hypothetical protein ACXWDN_15950 [Limisphaerales bacterium]